MRDAPGPSASLEILVSVIGGGYKSPDMSRGNFRIFKNNKDFRVYPASALHFVE